MRGNQSKQQEIYIDLTAEISQDTVIFPGDPSFKLEKISSIQKGQHYTLCQMHFGNHTGTHIDYPIHIIKQGKSSSCYKLNNLIQKGFVINVPQQAKSISKQFIKSMNIQHQIVLFKTANSKFQMKKPFQQEYVYIEPQAAEELVKYKVKIVGIDYLSVDRLEAEDLPVHKILLSNEVLIVEGLNLKMHQKDRLKFLSLLQRYLTQMVLHVVCL